MLCWLMLPFHKQCIFVCYDHVGVGIQHAGNDTMTTAGIPDKEQETMHMIDPAIMSRAAMDFPSCPSYTKM